MTQREIKFRAWDKKEKKMVFLTINALIATKELMLNDVLSALNNGFSLMQYVGLKDKNGKEIYDGDMILLWENDKKGVAVLWDEEISGFGFKRQDMATHLNFRRLAAKNYVVIGNIYENPDLLNRDI